VTLAEILADYRIVDLTVTLEEHVPCAWPGHQPFEHKVHNWYAELADGPQPLRSLGPYYTCTTTIDEHSGTHFDSPTHFVPPPDSGLPHANELGAQYGDRVTLDRLQGPAVVVDLRALADTGAPGESPRITPEVLAEWEDRNGSFEAGDVVVFQTGWDSKYVAFPDGRAYVHGALVTRDLPGWPAPSAEGVVHLYERGVRLLCTDAPSIGAADEGVTMHVAGLARGMLYVESLTLLEELPTRGAYFVFMPLKVARSSGANGRALAYVPR
jgi:kynurenine formamidase